MKTYSKIAADDEKSIRIPCPVCRGTVFKKLWQVESSIFVRCADCRLILQNPQPVRTALAARYDIEYFQYEIENEETFFHLMMLALDDIDFFESITPTLPQPNRILDIGCATGRLLSYFKQAGWETAGAELCRESAEYGNKIYNVNIRPAPLETAGFPDHHFSVVHASHLIEHVDDPRLFVTEVLRVLMPGGVFLCVTPASDGLQAKLFGASWRSVIPDHVTLFDRKTLRRLMEAAGFSVMVVRTWGGLGVGTAPAWLKKPVDRLAKKWGFGDVVLMAARKTS